MSPRSRQNGDCVTAAHSAIAGTSIPDLAAHRGLPIGIARRIAIAMPRADRPFNPEVAPPASPYGRPAENPYFRLLRIGMTIIVVFAAIGGALVLCVPLLSSIHCAVCSGTDNDQSQPALPDRYLSRRQCQRQSIAAGRARACQSFRHRLL